MSTIGKNIRAERIKAKLKQYQLAQALEVGQTAISRFESGARRPSVEQLKKIAATLGCSFAELVYEEQEENDDPNNYTSNDEDDLRKCFIQLLLSKNPNMSVKLRSLAKRSKELTPDDWLLLTDHIAHAFSQIELLLGYRDMTGIRD